MSLFTPVSGLIGGSLIGAAAGSLLLLNGDIMGYSGILSSVLLHPIRSFRDHPWKLTFLATFAWASTCYVRYVDPQCLDTTSSSGSPTQLAFMLSGFLVGLGTKLSNGCTSGHGICGMARFSKRSFVAVISFMLSGIVTSCLLTRTNQDDVSPLRSDDTTNVLGNTIHPDYGLAVTVLCILTALPNLTRDEKTLGAAISASLGAVGLAISGMIRWTKVNDFLNITNLWRGTPKLYDPTLACVMGSGVVVSWVSYQFLSNYSTLWKNEKDKCLQKPFMSDTFHVPTNTTIDWKLIVGALVFGVGWGIGDLCPGPAMFHAAVGSEGVLYYWLPNFVIGAYLAEAIKKYCDNSKATSTSKAKAK